VKVGVGGGGAVTVGLGESIGVAEAAGTVAGMFVASGEGAGCELQALKSTRDSTLVRNSDFMGAIMAEAASRVKRTPSVDMPLPVCYTGAKSLLSRRCEERCVRRSNLQHGWQSLLTNQEIASRKALAMTTES